MKSSVNTLSLIAIFFFVFTFSSVAQQAGTLDSSFGVNGKVTTDFFDSPDTIQYATATAIQSDDKIVVAGYFYVSDYHANFVVARYAADGSLDSTFGINGKMVTYFTRAGLATAYPKAVFILPEGKILVGGYRVDAPGSSPNEKTPSQGINYYFVFARFMANGDIDSSFGSNGQVQYLIGAFSPFGQSMNAMMMQPDGSILTAGQLDGFCIIKFLANGSVDSSFAINGKFVDPTSGFYPNDITIDSVGRILIAGYMGYDIAVRRFSATGVVDSSYADSGILTVDFFGLDDVANSILLLNDQSIVLAGYADSSGVKKIALLKCLDDGFIDSAFGNNGKVTYNFGLNTYATKLLMQSDGKFIVAGEMNDSNFLVARVQSNGSIDYTFGINGTNTATFGNTTLLKSAALQIDEKLVTVGRPAFSLARFKSDEPVTISMKKNISLPEGSSGATPALFKVVLNKPSTQTIKVNYTTVDGTAKAGTDYVATSGTLTFKPGQVSKSVVVNIIGDNVAERNEKFSLQLSNPQNAILGSLSTATCIIKNDDAGFANAITEENSSITNNITLYPNPVKDVLRIQGLNAKEKTTISIVDMQGRATIKTTAPNETASINVKQLSAGTYLVKIEADKKITTLKFVKE